ncbi:MAG: DUF1343 domain-containing protein [Flavobacteriales bacterium]|nr:DUF1343 domain-containing protein [Flavobacteriales bacterium]
MAKIALLQGLMASSSVLQAQSPPGAPVPAGEVRVGAERTAEYLPLLKDKRVAVVTNQTGTIGRTHLVDSLLSLGVQVTKVFAPEHGFRGDRDAGEHVKDGVDQRSGLPVVSLYGNNKKPSPEQLPGVQVVVFDIQDVGVRFYTYLSTLHLVMEACAEAGIPLVVLDRPNPNGFFVDGPVLDMGHRSFVGMHPIPLVHGMTLGELAGMINGEKWLAGGVRCELTVIPCAGYDHRMAYVLPIKPSPNLPNMSAVYLYPSLGLFEGTVVSVGRGTDKPFQCIGHPGAKVGSYAFSPRPMPGAKDPPYKGDVCTGLDLSEYGDFHSKLMPRLSLHWLIGFYAQYPSKERFFNAFFDKLAGGPTLREQVQAGWDEERIRLSWRPGLQAFMQLRQRYLLYDDFL